MSNPSYPSIAQNFQAGDKLAGCYTLKEMLPVQGFCVVWLAHDDELNKDIVLHFVPDSVAADSRAMTELKQEAKRNRQLIHPRIIRVHDLIEDEKWAAISMDYVQGEPLSALQKKREKNAFNPSEIAAGISELCQTLEDAHRIDLYHRDLTPENLLATGNGVMVQKFGLSRVILESLGRGGQQIEGFRDIAYISPQQLDGERPSGADDIYSLGASLFDLLTGAPPFVEGDVIGQIRKTVPPLVSERRAEKGIGGESMPKAWDDTIAACLAKSPEDRPKSAAEAGSRFASGKAGSAPAAPAAAAVAAATAEPPPPAGDAPAKEEAPASAPPEQEAAAKQQKRPWGSGPGKTPVIAEATVLSKTPVPKSEKSEKGEGAASAKPGEPDAAAPATPATAGGAKKGGPGGPTTPTGFPLRAFVEVEGDPNRKKGKSSAGLILVCVVLLLIGIVGYLVAKNSGGSGSQSPENSVASTSGNSDVHPASSESSAPPAPEAAASPAPAEPVNVAANATPAPEEATATAAPPAVAESTGSSTDFSSMTGAQADQLIAEKAKAVDQAKAALADAEKASKDKAAAQAQAAAAVQDLQATIKQKSDAAAAAKKAADTAGAAVKEQQDAMAKAEADAAEAQKEAAAKVQAADQLRKAVQDAQAAAQQQTTEAAKRQEEADAAAKAVADRQQTAVAAAKAAADAEKALQQQAQALAQAQADLGQAQTGLQQAQQSRVAEKARKAAEDAARIRKEREAETARLTAQAAAASKAAEDAQKALDAAKKAVADAEKAQQAAEQQAEAARAGISSMGSPAPAPEATPAATPPPGAAAGPGASVTSPSLTVHALNPHLRVDQALSNSLGMRFAPVGNVFFCIWLTRVQDFEAFANATGFKGNAWREPGFKQGPDHPVVNVSWNDANQFCLWLTEKEHHEGILAINETYRLPTDLEWSNAVGLPPESGRTPESRDMDVPDVYPWGTQWPPPAGAGNYTGEETDSDVAIKGYNDGFAWTSPVGSFTVNKFGLYDMGGNVWEWCMDWWNSEQKAKVLRGGSWYNGALKLSLLSSCRIHANAAEGTDNYGFRVVIAEEMSKPKKHAE